VFALASSELGRPATVTGLFADLLECLILFRAVRSRALSHYPFFFASIFCSLAGGIVVSTVRVEMPVLYPRLYWEVQFVTLLAACGIVLEIFNHVLSGYPGADKLARTLGIAVFAIVGCFSMLYPASHPSWAGSVIELERDIRTVQAIFLCAILLIILHYRIPVGKNVRGLMVGYGFYIFLSLLSLATRAYVGRAFDEGWRLIQPIAYDACLVIWVSSLWTYAPDPVSDPRVRLESDYEVLASRTRGALGSMRSYLKGSIRS